VSGKKRERATFARKELAGRREEGGRNEEYGEVRKKYA